MRLASDRAVRGTGAPTGRLLQRLDALDLALYRRAASAHPPLLVPAMNTWLWSTQSEASTSAIAART